MAEKEAEQIAHSQPQHLVRLRAAWKGRGVSRVRGLCLAGRAGERDKPHGFTVTVRGGGHGGFDLVEYVSF